MLQYFHSVEVAKRALPELERLETLYEHMTDGPEKRCLLRKIADIKSVRHLTAT